MHKHHCNYRHAKGNPNFLLDSESVTPVIVPSQKINNFGDLVEEAMTFRVHVEGSVICETPDFIFAFMVLFASFYAFNLSYPPKLNGTLTFIQKFVLDIGDGLIGKIKR